MHLIALALAHIEAELTPDLGPLLLRGSLRQILAEVLRRSPPAGRPRRLDRMAFISILTPLNRKSCGTGSAMCTLRQESLRPQLEQELIQFLLVFRRQPREFDSHAVFIDVAHRALHGDRVGAARQRQRQDGSRRQIVLRAAEHAPDANHRRHTFDT